MFDQWRCRLGGGGSGEGRDPATDLPRPVPAQQRDAGRARTALRPHHSHALSAT